jgi:tungstate transport system ATP-binding protein
LALYEILNLKHRYDASLVVDIDRLTIGRGSIVGLLGPNGSGKSTLLRILAFLEKWTRGEIRFEGRSADLNDRSLRRKVTLLFQDPYLLKRSVFENVAYGIKVRGENGKLKERVHEALNWVGLSPEKFAHRPWYALSGGEARRVALASRLVLKPRVLLLDEPTSGIDANSVSLIKTASVRAREEWGTTLIIATHDRFWLHAVAERTLNLVEGRLTRTGPDNFFHGPFGTGPEGLPKKVLENGVVIDLPPKPTGALEAAVEASAIHLHRAAAEPAPEVNSLECLLIQTTLENHSGNLLVGLAGGGVQWIAEMGVEDFRSLRLHPGDSCRISFEVSSIRWR